MLHPIFSLLMNRPELVADHVAGYASLAREEVSNASSAWIRRALAGILAVLLAAVFVALAGGAAMLGALHNQFHWALIAVPGVALLMAVAAIQVARQPSTDRAFTELKTQVQMDLQTFRNATQQQDRQHDHP